MKILVLHGINLDMFGKRDPQHYGTITLPEIDAQLRKLATELDVSIETFHSNHEGVMCERIHRAHEQDFAAVVGNGSIFATQFHPEKSQEAGLRILKNFIQW